MEDPLLGGYDHNSVGVRFKLTSPGVCSPASGTDHDRWRGMEGAMEPESPPNTLNQEGCGAFG